MTESDNETGTALQLQSVTCEFTGREGSRYRAVAEVSLTVGLREFVSVVGPTGCGKTTLLNVAAGLLAPSSGTITAFGATLKGINRDAGYVFQVDALLPWRTALANVTFGAELRGISASSANELARDWLARVGLSGFEDRYPHELSGGMRKRVQLAQTLSLEPRIVLMDEPFSALDVQTRALMENELLELWQREHRAVLFVTHDLEEAISLSDRVIVLSAGPAAQPVAEYNIDLPRPRDVAEIRLTPEFLKIHQRIWSTLREQVMLARERMAKSIPA